MAREYFVYILASETRELYIGVTNDYPAPNSRTQGRVCTPTAGRTTTGRFDSPASSPAET